MPDAREALVERLVRLGFSQYEGRAYVGLLVRGEQTGYALANATGVPQPKIYETLRRLRERGAIVLTTDHPARYAPVPAESVLASLEQDFARRVRAAHDELARLPKPAPEERIGGRTRALAGRDEVLARAIMMI